MINRIGFITFRACNLLSLLTCSCITIDFLHNNLVREITIRKDSIITTSCAFVLIKNGRLMMLANKCINAPTVADTCNTIKYAVTIRNDPNILPCVSIAINMHSLIMCTLHHGLDAYLLLLPHKVGIVHNNQVPDLSHPIVLE